jgi:hypothetical protein
MNEKARSLLEAARRELSRKRVKKALKYISDAVQADPDSHELLAERAAMAISPLRAYRDAADDMTRAIQLAPDVGDYYDLRGQAYWYLREYERAYEDFNKAIEVDPACARAYYHRGNFAEKLQRYESAIEDMKRAVELDPESRSYKRRLEELKRAATRHAERVGEEPPAVALEVPAALEEAPIEEAELIEEPEAEAEAPPEEEPVEEEPPVAAEAPAEEPAAAPVKPGAPPVQVVPPPQAPAAQAVPPAEVAVEKWSVRIPTGERFGPVSMAVLKLWAEEQRVKPEDHLLTPKGGWVPAKNVAEIAAVFENLRTTKKPPVRPD